MKSSSYFHGGNHREAAKRYGLSPNEIRDFSANIKNLKAAGEAQNLIIVEKEPIEKRDYTEGKATKLYHELKANATLVKNSHGVLDTLKSMGSGVLR